MFFSDFSHGITPLEYAILCQGLPLERSPTSLIQCHIIGARPPIGRNNGRMPETRRNSAEWCLRHRGTVFETQQIDAGDSKERFRSKGVKWKGLCLLVINDSGYLTMDI